MSDKFANMPSRVRHFWVVAFSPSSADNERIVAMHEVDRYLKDIHADCHDVVARVEKPPAKSLNKAEIDSIFEAGRANGRTEEVELRQRAVSVIASHMADDISDGNGGYSWREIAGHCLANLQRIPSNHHGFIESVADRLAGGHELTRPQAEYLRNLFRRHFNGTIT